MDFHDATRRITNPRTLASQRTSDRRCVQTGTERERERASRLVIKDFGEITDYANRRHTPWSLGLTNAAASTAMRQGVCLVYSKEKLTCMYHNFPRVGLHRGRKLKTLDSQATILTDDV